MSLIFLLYSKENSNFSLSINLILFLIEMLSILDLFSSNKLTINSYALLNDSKLICVNIDKSF